MTTLKLFKFKKSNYHLKQLFKTSYESGEDQVYRGGYVAVRFMFEAQLPKLTIF